MTIIRCAKRWRGSFALPGYEIKTFASAQEFIESTPETDGVACLVLDVRMPGFNGLDLQNAMRAANMPIPIIFITGHGDIPMSVRAMKAGAVDFLSKPVQSKALLGPSIKRWRARHWKARIWRKQNSCKRASIV